MTEGVSTGSAPSPSNGSSAAQSPAPGVSSTTPTPKNGEGAVANSPLKGATSATGTPEQKWQPVRTKLKFGDGTEEDVEIPDEETLQRRLIAAKALDRTQKELLKERKEREAHAAKLKEMGFDPANPDAWFEKRLQEKARLLEMTPEQQAVEQAKQEAARTKQEAQAHIQKMQRELAELQDARAWQELEPRLQKAMQQNGMIGDSFAMESIERVAKEFLDAGLDVPPEQVVAEAAARDKERFDARIQKVPAAELRKRLTPEQFKGIADIFLAEWKAKRAPGAPVAVPQKPTEPEAPRGYIDPYEAKRKFGF